MASDLANVAVCKTLDRNMMSGTSENLVVYIFQLAESCTKYCWLYIANLLCLVNYKNNIYIIEVIYALYYQL